MKPVNIPIEKSPTQRATAWLLAVVAIGLPILFDPWCMDTFNLPKLTLLRFISIAVIGLVVFDLLRNEKIIWRGGRAALFFGVFVLLVVVSTMFSAAPNIAMMGVYGFRIDGLLSWISYAILFGFGVIYFDREKMNAVAVYLVVGGILVSGYALIQYLGFDALRWGLDPTHARVWASFGNPNFLAAYIAMIVPFNLALFLAGSSLHKRVLGGCGLFFGLWVLAQALSRAAWLATVIGIVVFLVLSGSFKKFFTKKILIGALGGFIVLGLFTPWARISERLSSGTSLQSPEWILRMAGWKTALSLAKEKPILGHGAEGYHLNFRRHMDATFFRVTRQRQISPLLPHNEVAQILVTVGGLGLLVYLLFLFSLFAAAVRLRNDVFIAALPAALIASLINNQFSFHTIATAALFFFMAGILAGLAGRSITVRCPVANKTGELIVFAVFAALALWAAAFSLRVYKADRLFKEASRADEKGFMEISLKTYQHVLAANKLEPHYLHRFANVGLRMADKSQNPQAKQGWLKGIENVFRSIVKLNPTDALAYNGIGTILARLHREYRTNTAVQAEEAFRHAAQLDPQLVEAWTNLGALYQSDGKTEAAHAAYATAKDLNPYDPQIYYDIGVLNALSNNWEAAKRSWHEALEIDPKYEPAMRALELPKNKNQGAKK